MSNNIYERGVPGGALNLNSTGYHGRYGDLPLQGKIPTTEPGIEPGTSWLVIISSDHQATRMVQFFLMLAYIICERRNAWLNKKVWDHKTISIHVEVIKNKISLKSR
jgi:hypothetical protein